MLRSGLKRLGRRCVEWHKWWAYTTGRQRRERQNVSVWQTGQGYYLQVLSRSLLNIAVFIIHDYCQACQTRFAVFSLLPSFGVSGPMALCWVRICDSFVSMNLIIAKKSDSIPKGTPWPRLNLNRLKMTASSSGIFSVFYFTGHSHLLLLSRTLQGECVFWAG